MTVYSLTWLPEVLLKAGLKVSEVVGWRERGHGDVGKVKGVMCHHTAGPIVGNMPSLGVITNGRSDLPGPLANLGLGRDGTYYVVAAGKAYHAGAGEWHGVTNGNSEMIGIEAENNGTTEPWPAVQMDAYARGCAALLKRIRTKPEMATGHKEYARPRGRKIDPNFDMIKFRRTVDQIMNGSLPPIVIPDVDDQSRKTIRRGDAGSLVTDLQRALGVRVDGKFGPQTEAAVRAFQKANAPLVPDGIVGPKTWSVLMDGKRPVGWNDQQES